MIVNGVEVNTKEALEGAVSSLDEDSKAMLRSLWDDEYKILSTQQLKREFGQQHIGSLIDKMGERNQVLINSGATVNIIAIASDNAGLKLLIETGALGNAISLCGMLKLKYPTHKDIYEGTVTEFNRFLQSIEATT